MKKARRYIDISYGIKATGKIFSDKKRVFLT